jgi:small subunit ribosomal protein S7
MRRHRAPKRELKPDPKYNSTAIGQLINIVMQDGRKSLAQNIVYDAFLLAQEKLKEDSQKIFFAALENARPRLEVRPRRIGGATYQVPMEVPQERGVSIALRWLCDAARSKKNKAMNAKLAEEIISAYKNEGSVIKRKEETHKMAEANRAFAHFKW